MSNIFKKQGFKSVCASILCILCGLIIGFVVMVILSLVNDSLTVSDAFHGLTILLGGPFSSGTAQYVVTNLGDMIFYATPLIMTGVSVAIAYKTGLFNIGAAGQFLMGTMGSLLVALNINTTGKPGLGILVWVLALIVGALFGMIWGAIPGLFKAFFNVNEVIVCIMTNWIAANVVTWVFSSMPQIINTGSGKSGYLITTSVTGNGTPKIGLDKLFSGSYLDLGIIIAVAIAIMIYIMLTKTTFGYELRACGANKYGARYAGMNEKRNIVLSMAIAGGLAAVGGAIYYLNPGIEFKFSSAYQKLPDYGFNGIPAALLGSSNPIAVIFVSLFIRYLSIGGDNLSSAGFNKYIADVIIALIIYFAGFSRLFGDLLSRKKKKAAVTAAPAAPGAIAAAVSVVRPEIMGDKDTPAEKLKEPEKASDSVSEVLKEPENPETDGKEAEE